MLTIRNSLVSNMLEHGEFSSNSDIIESILVLTEDCIKCNPQFCLSIGNRILYFRSVNNRYVECREFEAEVKLVSLNIPKSDYYVLFKKESDSWCNPLLDTKQRLVGQSVDKVRVRYCEDSFLEYLNNMLFYKENWYVVSGDRKDFFRLKSHLSNLCAIVRKFLTVSPDFVSKSVIYSTDKKRILFDTNLLNSFGNRIFLCHDIHVYFDRTVGNSAKRYINPKIIGNQKDAESAGFVLSEYLNLEPLPLYQSPSELVFDGNIQDFDLEDVHHFGHIIDHRENRLPSFVKDMDSVSLFYMLKNSIELAVKQNNVDYKHIVPCYSITDLKIWFLLPVYQLGSFREPVCALLLDKNANNRWTIYTILELEQAYLSARLVAPPCGWLSI